MERLSLTEARKSCATVRREGRSLSWITTLSGSNSGSSTVSGKGRTEMDAIIAEEYGIVPAITAAAGK